MGFTIRTKFLAGFGTMLLLMGVVGSVGWRYNANLEAAFERLYKDSVQGTVQLARAESALWQLRYGFPQLLVLGAEERPKIISDQAKCNTVHIRFDADVAFKQNPPNPPLPKGGEGGFCRPTP
jgi:hypothetical protein